MLPDCYLAATWHALTKEDGGVRAHKLLKLVVRVAMPKQPLSKELLVWLEGAKLW